MKILMVSSECHPFAKTGGLADVVNSLSASLSENGINVRIVIPGYSDIKKKWEKKESLPAVTVPLGFTDETVTFEEYSLGNSGVPVYLVIHDLFTGRDGMYGGSGSSAYRDNHRRFSLLNLAALHMCVETGWIPDILHVHDWQASLIPAYIKENIPADTFGRTKTVLTIHNIGYQGTFSKHDIHTAALPWKRVSNSKASYRDTFNFLKTGILNSDAVTTVSPSYAVEILTPEYGGGLEKILEERKDSLFGILNGADYTEWNPESDPYLPLRYTPEDLSNKKKLKTILQKKCGFPEIDDKPVIGMVSRLVYQKGFEEMCGKENGALEKICGSLNVQVVILGTGERHIEERLEEMDREYKNLRVFLAFDNELAHLIEAGSDFFLMPSIYEPCGLNQIYSLKYGTIPIVTKTGGLRDTVEDFRSDINNGTGFHIKAPPNPESIYNTVKNAVELWYSDRGRITEIKKRGMRKDFSWNRSAEEYLKLYRKLICG